MLWCYGPLKLSGAIIVHRVALDLPYWTIRSALYRYRLSRMAIEMAREAGAFFLSSIICLA